MYKCLIASVLYLLLWAASCRADEKVALAVGDRAPIFMLRSTTNEWVSLRDFCGSLRNPWKNSKRVVVASFWATYCVPCKKEIPQLDSLMTKYKNEVKLLLISVDREGHELVAPHVQEMGYRGQVLLDPYARAAVNYGVNGVPALFLIDRGGILRYSCHGYKEEAVAELGRILDSLTAPAKPVESPSQPEAPQPDTAAATITPPERVPAVQPALQIDSLR